MPDKLIDVILSESEISLTRLALCFVRDSSPTALNDEWVFWITLLTLVMM